MVGVAAKDDLVVAAGPDVAGVFHAQLVLVGEEAVREANLVGCRVDACDRDAEAQVDVVLGVPLRRMEVDRLAFGLAEQRPPTSSPLPPAKLPRARARTGPGGPGSPG